MFSFQGVIYKGLLHVCIRVHMYAYYAEVSDCLLPAEYKFLPPAEGQVDLYWWGVREQLGP